MKLALYFLVFLSIFLIIAEETSARRTSSSRSSSRSRSSYGSRSSSGSRGSSSSGSHRSGTSYGGSHGSTYGSSHGTSGTSHGTASTGTASQGHSSSHQQHKDASTSFLNAEGGGASRPSTGNSPNSINTNQHVASAPPLHSGPSSYPSSSGPFSPAKPTQTGSAPPLEHVSKVSTGTSHTPGATNVGHPSGSYNTNTNQQYPPWANPHLNTNNQQSSNIGFQSPSSHISSPPYPVNGPNHPMPGASGPHPSPPYPVGGSGHGYPMGGSGGSGGPGYAGYPMGGSGGSGGPGYAGYPIGGSGGYGYPSGMPGIAGPSTHYNSYGQPNSPPIGNPYSTHPAGTPFGAPGQPQYAPQMLSQPAAQPFTPGQTVIMMPGQQDSGRGLGQIFKEALVFSTVNAAVNRVINPHPHYISESRPVDSGSSAPITHITYNNQYFNTYPGANGTVDGGQMGGAAPIANSPMPGVAGVPSVPGSSGAPGFPVGNAANIGPAAGMAPGITAEPTAGATGSGIAAPSNQNGQTAQTTQANASTNYVPQYRVSDDDLLKISEELFSKQAYNLSKYITVNLQNRSSSEVPNITDEAVDPLFLVQPELLEYPSVYVTRALYDNYEFDSRKKETQTAQDRNEENLLIDTFLETNVMSRAMQWLAQHSFIDPDDFERKDAIRRIWFKQFDGSTSGFERVFTAEKYGDTDILGVQDWLYFEDQETKKRIDYMGYVDKLDLGTDASLIKLNFKMDGIIRPNATIFVGTLPELEMSLYTICFYARPNNLCPVSLGGAKFNIFTHSFRYFGSDLVDLALPMF